MAEKFVSFREKRLEEKTEQKHKPRRKWRLWQMILGGLGIAGVILAAVMIWWGGDSGAVGFSFPGQKPAEELQDGRVTVLLLGMAGGNHDGALLTDSIIVASYDPKTKRAVLISIPRDLWINDISQKVNAVYEFGLKNNNGLGSAEEAISKIIGIQIDYALRLDFSGFEKAIDLVGGVDVDVPKTFDDYVYPIQGKEDDLCGNSEQVVNLTQDQANALGTNTGPQRVLVTPAGNVATTSADFGCRYEHVHFDQGVTHLNGAQALVLVRSRHGTNGEGSDFARSLRQQRVIEAFRAKVLSLDTLVNPQKVLGLIDTFGQSFETDVPPGKYLEMYKMSKNIDKIDSIVLGQLDNGKSLFITPPVGEYGAWVLIPPNNDFSGVIDLVKQALEGSESAKLASPSPARAK